MVFDSINTWLEFTIFRKIGPSKIIKQKICTTKEYIYRYKRTVLVKRQRLYSDVQPRPRTKVISHQTDCHRTKALSHQGHPTKIIFHYAYQRLYTTNVIRTKSIPPRLYPSKAAYHIPPRSSDKDYKPPRSSDKGYIQTVKTIEKNPQRSYSCTIKVTDKIYISPRSSNNDYLKLGHSWQ